MNVIPSVEIGVQPKCHGELSTFNFPQEESDIWYSGNCDAIRRKLTEKQVVSALMQDRSQNG